MSLVSIPPFVLSVLVLGTAIASPNHVNQYSQTINTLEDHLLRDIGFSQKPRIEKAKVSEDDYLSKLAVYNEILRQSREIKILRRKFHHLQFTTPTQHMLKLSNVSHKTDGVQILMDMSSVNELSFGMTLVKKATLKLRLRRKNLFVYSTKLRLAQNILEDNDTVVESVDISDIVDREADVSFDVTDTIQAWFMAKETERGFTLLSDEFEIVTDGDKAPIVEVDSIFSLTRQRRSLFPEFFSSSKKDDNDEARDCSADDNKCCRDNMIVDLTQLEGFDFIVEPKQFNAFMCRGRCPARYRPLNDHSLLQSLMHLKQQKEENLLENLDDKIRRPCCVPSKLSSLPILHLDENNPSKLKVTLWHSIVVTECACA